MGTVAPVFKGHRPVAEGAGLNIDIEVAWLIGQMFRRKIAIFDVSRE